MALTVVFDTNILFSATGWCGNPFQCVEHARAGRINAVTCPELIQELAEKLDTKMKFSPDQTTETLADYLSFHRLVSIPKTLDAVPRDADDNAVLECALEGGASHIVTGDDHLLVLKEFRGVQIVRANEFLKILAAQPGSE